MTKRVTIAMAAALTVSCVHQKRAATVAAPAAPQTVWDRQVHNASDAGDGDYVLKGLRQRVAAEPDNIPVRLELAKAYRDRGYPDMAVELCRLTVERFPQSAEAQLALVRGLFEMKRPAEAIAALEAHPRDTADYHSWLGLLRDSMGAWTAGEPSHRKAIELAPAQDGLHNNLGYNLLMQKKGEEAAAEFREALRLNPASQLARNNLGLALASTNTQQALASWQAASDPATAHSNLAAVWIEKGNYAEARKELAVALGYNKSHSAALRNLQLVAQLDGQASAWAPGSADSRWIRWKTGFKKLFVGPLDTQQRDSK
jgi:tetratricopeptide (TPR) repeat protein